MERICGAGLMLPGRDVLESSSGMPLSSVSRKEDTAVLPLHFCVQPGSVRAPGKSHRDVPVVRYRHVVGRGLQVAAARFWVDDHSVWACIAVVALQSIGHSESARLSLGRLIDLSDRNLMLLSDAAAIVELRRCSQ